jgi:hypothetical protein
MINFLKSIFNQPKNSKKISMNIFQSILEKSRENQEIISIWQYNSDKSSLVGYVTEISEEHITLKHYTVYGKCDGLIAIKIANIKTIDFNDDYTKVMECVIQYSSIFDKPTDFHLNIGYSNNWQFDALHKLVTSENQVASFEINGTDYFTGLVTEISQEDFVLNCIGKNGEDQGSAVYRIEDITEIRINDLDNRRRLLLYNWRKASL